MDARIFEETVVTRVFSLPSPTPLAELEKAAAVARRELTEQNQRVYDDTIMVVAHDDEIRLVYVKEKS